MLKIDNLHVRAGEREILKGLSLDVAPGQVPPLSRERLVETRGQGRGLAVQGRCQAER